MDWIGDFIIEEKYVEGCLFIFIVICMSGKLVLVIDGLFVEIKEFIGGYFIVKVNLLDEVKEMVKGFLDFDLDGIVEIREVL